MSDELTKAIIDRTNKLESRLAHLEAIETPPHDILSAHTVVGSAMQVVGLTAANTLGLLTPSAAPVAGELLKADGAGGLALQTLTGKANPGLILESAAADKELLRFATERAWSFWQRSTGASTRLELRSAFGGKWFDIANLDGEILASFFAGVAASSNNYVEFCEGRFRVNDAGQIQAATQGTTGGLLLGGDALLYRDGADVLRTPDSLVVDGTVAAGTTSPGAKLGVDAVASWTTSHIALHNSGSWADQPIRIIHDGAFSLRNYRSTAGEIFNVRDDADSIRLSIQRDGRTGIGTNAPATSALLDLTSVTGALLVPRMTTTQRDALTAADGMIIMNTTTSKLQGRQGGAWVDLA